jgi:K+-transporting ATPase KdpF subunit
MKSYADYFMDLHGDFICFWLFFKSVDWFEKFKIMVNTLLLIISVAVFIYLCYVLVKPENFNRE